MSGRIFISYRREDAPYVAGRLYDRLSAHFAQNQIFMGVDRVPGVSFVEAIEKDVGSCDVLIAVIGQRWLSHSDEEEKRRLDRPKDFVRREIAIALKRGIPVIPVLVEGASMPGPDQLPEDLKALARRQALAVSHERFQSDPEQLIGAVERALGTARMEQPRGREEQEGVDSESRGREGEDNGAGPPRFGPKLREPALTHIRKARIKLTPETPKATKWRRVRVPRETVVEAADLLVTNPDFKGLPALQRLSSLKKDLEKLGYSPSAARGIPPPMLPPSLAALSKSLGPAHAEKVRKAVELYQIALNVFHDGDAVRDWFARPAYGLGERTPLEMLGTEGGAVVVREYLEAIEQGNYW